MGEVRALPNLRLGMRLENIGRSKYPTENKNRNFRYESGQLVSTIFEERMVFFINILGFEALVKDTSRSPEGDGAQHVDCALNRIEDIQRLRSISSLRSHIFRLHFALRHSKARSRFPAVHGVSQANNRPNGNGHLDTGRSIARADFEEGNHTMGPSGWSSI